MPKTQFPADANDALNLLIDDHEEVKSLFADFESLSDDEVDSDIKFEIAQQICQALTIHAQVENDLFYPAVRDMIADDALMDEAEAEHDKVADAIALLDSMSPSDEDYDAEVGKLAEMVARHVQKEEQEMFPKVKATGMETTELGKQMEALKDELALEREPAFNARSEEYDEAAVNRFDF